MYYVRFENSSTAKDAVGHPHPVEFVEAGPFSEFLQLTYGLLRSGPDGDNVAEITKDGCWEYQSAFYSDVVVYER